jgi:hypothetical protein
MGDRSRQGLVDARAQRGEQPRRHGREWVYARDIEANQAARRRTAVGACRSARRMSETARSGSITGPRSTYLAPGRADARRLDGRIRTRELPECAEDA